MSIISSISSISSLSSISSISLFESSSEDEYYEEINLSNNSEPHIHISGSQQMKKPRIQSDFFKLTEKEFKERFRLNKKTVTYLFNLIGKKLEHYSDRNNPVSPMNQLLITLRYYSCGSCTTVMESDFSVTKSTITRIVHKVTVLLASLREYFVRMPMSKKEREQTSEEFLKICNFPGVLGAIDTTHVRILSPGGDNAEDFRNQNGWFSINTQIVCDAKFHITDIVARWPGAVHDDHIFNYSLIKTKFENNVFGDYCLLGHNAYTCRKYLLTPVPEPVNAAEENYNKAHYDTTSVIDTTINALKRRFPCLFSVLRISLSRSLTLIVATAVLHNIATDLNDDYEEFPEIEDEEIICDDIIDDQESIKIRRNFINSVFAK